MYPKAKHLIVILVFLISAGDAFSQSTGKSLYFWKLHSVTGEFLLNGFYREQERSGPEINEYLKSSFLTGGVFLRTNSSILNKNFLSLDIDAGYMPATSRDNFLVIPDQAEVSTIKKIGGISATFFQQKNITLNIFGNYEERYFARENLTDIKSIDRNWGSILNYNNKFLPVTIDFHNKKWNEEELESGRNYTMDQKLFGARMSKSFTNRDRNDLHYSHDDNVNVNQNLFRIANTIDNIDFTSRINIDTKQKFTLNTTMSNLYQRGYTNIKRFQASEGIFAQLPANLSVFSNYNFIKTRYDASDLTHNNITAALQHKLFQSLQSRINFEYNHISHTIYREHNTKTGFELNYAKKIPRGQFTLSYKYDKYRQNYTSDPSDLKISNEQYTLSDSKIVLLRLPDVDPESVTVKDITGTLIYEPGLDYILIERNQYIEIRRIPGGLIPDNSVVQIDYIATQPGAYEYDANSHVVNTNIYLFDNLLSFYYRFSTQDYSNLVTTEFVTLNYFNQNLAGFRLDFDFINGGAEYEDYKSSILPYHMWRYYLNFQKNIGKKLIFMLTGNIQDYVMLDKPEPEYQKYMDFSSKAIYPVYKSTNINLDLMYRKQTGRGIDLDLMTAKAEINSSYNRLYVAAGVEVYKRNYVGETINFKGIYFKLVRKF